MLNEAFSFVQNSKEERKLNIRRILTACVKDFPKK